MTAIRRSSKCGLSVVELAFSIAILVTLFFAAETGLDQSRLVLRRAGERMQAREAATAAARELLAEPMSTTKNRLEKEGIGGFAVSITWAPVADFRVGPDPEPGPSVPWRLRGPSDPPPMLVTVSVSRPGWTPDSVQVVLR